MSFSSSEPSTRRSAASRCRSNGFLRTTCSATQFAPARHGSLAALSWLAGVEQRACWGNIVQPAAVARQEAAILLQPRKAAGAWRMLSLLSTQFVNQAGVARLRMLVVATDTKMLSVE